MHKECHVSGEERRERRVKIMSVTLMLKKVEREDKWKREWVTRRRKAIGDRAVADLEFKSSRQTRIGNKIIFNGL